MFAYNLTMSDFDNDTCWFWIKRNDEWDNNKIGCSPVYTCREGKIATYDFNLPMHTSLVMIRTNQTLCVMTAKLLYRTSQHCINAVFIHDF